jgi:uncharacterized protein YndB with AHSA1/START domain
VTSTETNQVYVTFIQSTPERIWAAITQPEHSAEYFNGNCVQADLRPGGTFNHRASAEDATLVSEGRVLEVDPNRRLAVTWRALWSEDVAREVPGRVTWLIEPHDNADICKVTLIHDKLESAPCTAKQVFGDGWTMVLSGLKTYLETGRPWRSA